MYQIDNAGPVVSQPSGSQYFGQMILYALLLLGITYVIDHCDTLNIYSIAIKGVLKKLWDIFTNRIFHRIALCPDQKFSGIQGSLCHRKSEVQPQG